MSGVEHLGVEVLVSVDTAWRVLHRDSERSEQSDQSKAIPGLLCSSEAAQAYSGRVVDTRVLVFDGEL